MTVTWTVTDRATGEVVHQGSDAFWQADANALSQIDVFAWINNAMSGKVANLSITNYKSNAQYAEYKVVYVDANGNEIKESRTGNGQVGKFATLLDADKASLYNEDNTKKYIYDSDDSETVAIAESNTVITVKFRDAEVYNAVLNCMIEGTTGVANRLAQFQGTFFEGDNYVVYPSRAYGKEGVYYFTDATSWNGTSFTFPGSIAPATQSGKKYYIGTLYYAAIDSVAYYANFEDLALPKVDEGNGIGLGQLDGTVNSWYSFSGGYFDRFSGARGIRLDYLSYVWTEPIAEAGTYKVTIYGRNDKSAESAKPYALGYMLDGSVVTYTELTIPTWGSATTGTSVVEGVAIPAGANLIVMNTTEGDLISLDDISITKTGDYADPAIATGINETVQKVQNDGIIYNLNGQAVKTAKKGLYIQNGKKFIVK